MNDIDLPRSTSWHTSWLETAALSGAALAALVWLGPSPYLALAPLLAGARYGTHHGVACGLCLTLTLTGISGAATLPAEAGGAIVSLAWLVAGAISGAFRDAWARRMRGLETTSHLLRMRLEELGRAYHVLNASHERLQTLLAGQPSSLREALERLRDCVADTPSEINDTFAPRVLDLLRDHVGVRAATWHALDQARRPNQVIASLGVEGGAQEDALIRHAARLGEVISVRDVDGFEPGSTVVAVPLVDVEGTVHAVVAIRELPFVSLHEDTLSLLAVLGGHVGDLLSRLHTAPIERAVAPQQHFCAAVSRAIEDAHSYGIPSALLAVGLQPEASLLPSHAHLALQRIARKIAASRRATDLSDVLLDVHGHPRVFLLLRLADPAGFAQCQANLEKLARDEITTASIQCDVDMVGWSLDQASLPRRPAALEAFMLAMLRRGSFTPALVPAQEMSTEDVALETSHGQVA